jgi:hypothetical protein
MSACLCGLVATCKGACQLGCVWCAAANMRAARVVGGDTDSGPQSAVTVYELADIADSDDMQMFAESTSVTLALLEPVKSNSGADSCTSTSAPVCPSCSTTNENGLTPRTYSCAGTLNKSKAWALELRRISNASSDTHGDPAANKLLCCRCNRIDNPPSSSASCPLVPSSVGSLAATLLIVPIYMDKHQMQHCRRSYAEANITQSSLCFADEPSYAVGTLCWQYTGCWNQHRYNSCNRGNRRAGCNATARS